MYEHTVVCVLVWMKSFSNSEESIHSSEINGTSYESQADIHWEKTRFFWKTKNPKNVYSMPLG